MSYDKKCRLMCVFLSVMLIISGCSTTITTSIDHYLESAASLTYSECALFPEEKTLTTEFINFYRSETITSLLYDDVYFVLSCTYSDPFFAKEIARIQECNAEYREDIFHYPAYVMLCYGNWFEYALLDYQTKSIIYIAAETASFRYFKEFPQEFLPNNLTNVDICHY